VHLSAEKKPPTTTKEGRYSDKHDESKNNTKAILTKAADRADYC
jgi:hypothetical protein